MKRIHFFIQFALPALAAFAAALWCGSQKSMIFALFGFMGFFITAVTLVIEGCRKLKGKA